MTTVKTLAFTLENSLFAAYGRRRYEQEYTIVPAFSYSKNLSTLIEAFESAAGFEPEDAIVIVAADGYAQRIAGPKIYKEGESLVLKYGKQTAALTYDSGDILLNGERVLLTLEGENPIAVITIGKGLKANVPFRTVKTDVRVPGTEIIANLENGIYTDIQPVGVGSVNFSALKELPIGRYNVVKSFVASGKYGTKTKLTLSLPEAAAIVCSVSSESSGWTRESVDLAAGALVVVDANVSLTRALQGLTITANDKVVLDITGKTVDEVEGKTYVKANFDFSNSTFAFDF